MGSLEATGDVQYDKAVYMGHWIIRIIRCIENKIENFSSRSSAQKPAVPKMYPTTQIVSWN